MASPFPIMLNFSRLRRINRLKAVESLQNSIVSAIEDAGSGLVSAPDDAAPMHSLAAQACFRV